MSCTRTRAVLEKRKAVIVEERQAKKSPLTDADLKALLMRVTDVVIAKGKSSRRVARKDVTLDELRGPTGKFRAPMLISGKTLLVGFSESALEALLG